MPVSGPVAQMILLSGDKGSTLGSTSSTRYLLPSPREPKYWRAQVMFSGSGVQVPAVRLTRRIFPAQDMFVLLRGNQAVTWLPSLSAHCFMRSMPVQLASMKVMAPVGQASAHAGCPPQRSHFCTLPVAST